MMLFVKQALADLCINPDQWTEAKDIVPLLHAAIAKMSTDEDQIKKLKTQLQESERREERHWKLTLTMAAESAHFAHRIREARGEEPQEDRQWAVINLMAAEYADAARRSRERWRQAERMIRDLGHTPPAPPA